jgi:RNA polymerase sigma-70 factor, ECF subfamily
MAMNDEAITALFTAHHDAVVRYAIRRVGRNAAYDIASETFAIAFGHVVSPTDPLPWLYAIARNLIRNHVRAAGRRTAVGFLPDAEPDLATGVAERDALIAALRNLPEQSREALMLLAWEGLDSEAAAAVMGCSSTAYRMRLSRARRQLNAALASPAVGSIEGVTP